MAVDIEGLDVAVSRHVGTKIHNLVFRTPTLVGLLAGMDNYWNRPATEKSVQLSLEGGKMRFTFWAGKPKWEHGDPSNPDYNARRVNIVKRTKIKSGEIEAFSLKFAEPIDKVDIETLKTEDDLDNYGVQVAERAAESFIEEVDELMFPTTQAVAGAGAKGGRSSLLQFSYPLQNGYTANDETQAQATFEYLGIDMHSLPELKAINVGTDTTPFTPTEANIMQYLIMPLRQRGANIDMILVGEALYVYLRQVLAARIQQQPAKLMNFSGPYFQLDDGIFVIYEAGIDRLPKKEMYVGDSSTLRVGFSKQNPASFALIEDWAEIPDAHLLQGWARLAFVNECPRWWARGYNVVVPG